MLCGTKSDNLATNIKQFFKLCEVTATFLQEKQKKMRFYFVIREIMVIFALEIERQLIIELHFSTEKWNLICYS